MHAVQVWVLNRHLLGTGVGTCLAKTRCGLLLTLNTRVGSIASWQSTRMTESISSGLLPRANLTTGLQALIRSEEFVFTTGSGCAKPTSELFYFTIKSNLTSCIMSAGPRLQCRRRFGNCLSPQSRARSAEDSLFLWLSSRSYVRTESRKLSGP